MTMRQEIRDLKFPDCQFVFMTTGTAVGDFRTAWKSPCKRAGVVELVFHDLRRSAVRNMVRAGISEKIAMQISGHKARSVFDRYNIVSDRDLAEAATKMEQRFQAPIPTIPAYTSQSM
jgi:integrase